MKGLGDLVMWVIGLAVAASIMSGFDKAEKKVDLNCKYSYLINGVIGGGCK